MLNPKIPFPATARALVLEKSPEAYAELLSDDRKNHNISTFYPLFPAKPPLAMSATASNKKIIGKRDLRSPGGSPTACQRHRKANH